MKLPVHVIYQTFNFLTSLVYVPLLFSLFPFMPPSLLRYLLFSFTWMRVFSMERALSSESACALFSQMLFLLLFSLLRVTDGLFLFCRIVCHRFCLCVCLSLIQLRQESKSAWVQQDISWDSWWELSEPFFMLWSDLISTILISRVSSLLQMVSRPEVIGKAMTDSLRNTLYSCLEIMIIFGKVLWIAFSVTIFLPHLFVS